MRKKRFKSIEDAANRHKEIDEIAQRATKIAHATTKKMGIAVTYRKGNYIVKEYADGRIEKIAVHTNSSRKVKVGSRGKL